MAEIGPNRDNTGHDGHWISSTVNHVYQRWINVWVTMGGDCWKDFSALRLMVAYNPTEFATPPMQECKVPDNSMKNEFESPPTSINSYGQQLRLHRSRAKDQHCSLPRIHNTGHPVCKVLILISLLSETRSETLHSTRALRLCSSLQPGFEEKQLHVIFDRTWSCAYGPPVGSVTLINHSGRVIWNELERRLLNTLLSPAYHLIVLPFKRNTPFPDFPKSIIDSIVQRALGSLELLNSRWPRKQLLNYALVHRSWTHVLDIFFREMGKGVIPLPMVGNPVKIARSLLARPERGPLISELNLRHVVLAVDSEDFRAYKTIIAAASSTITKVDVSLQIFRHSLDEFAASQNMESFRLDDSYRNYNPTTPLTTPNEMIAHMHKIQACCGRWKKLKTLTINRWDDPPLDPDYKSDSCYKTFRDISKVPISSLYLYTGTLCRDNLIAFGCKTLTTLSLGNIRGVKNTDLADFLDIVAFSLTSLAMTDCHFPREQGEAHAVERALPSLRKLVHVHLGGETGLSWDIIAGRTEVVAPDLASSPLQNYGLTIVNCIPVPSEALSQALERTGWRDITIGIFGFVSATTTTDELVALWHTLFNTSDTRKSKLQGGPLTFSPTMKRHPAPRSVVSNHSHNSVLDISIRGDDLENSRVALENNLQHTEISLRLSATSDSEGEDLYHPQPGTQRHQSRAYHDSSEEDPEHASSVEYPRHNSNPGGFQEFVSFDRASRDHIGGLGDLSHHSSANPYSFSPDDDDDGRMHGIDPFPTPGFPSMSLGSGLGRGHGAGGETISTAAHHASALTLSPGFGGRYWAGRRKDASLSGAEYDPDRPLKDMLDHVGMGMDRLSVFDIEPSRSRYPGVTSPNQGPKMDTTADLDRILQSGHIPPSQLAQLRSPLNSSSSASSSSDHEHDAASNTSARSKPKLADALKSNLTFSPKRPRTMAVSPPRQTQARRETRFADDEPLEMPTPKPKKRLTSMGTPHPASGRVSNPQSIDNLSVVSAGSVKSVKSGKSNGSGKTTSDAGSQFTRMARGISKEIEKQRGAVAESSRKALAAQEAARKEKEEREEELERQLKERQERERQREEREREREAREREREAREREREREAREREAKEKEKEKERKKAAEAAKAARKPSAMKKPVADVSFGNANVFLPDVTGLTNAIESPAKGLGMGGYRLYGGDGGSPREVEARFVATLNNVQSKLLSLEEENGISRRRVRELEMELEDCKRDVKRERTRVLERESDLSMQRHHYDRKLKEKEKKDKGKAKARDGDDWMGERRYQEAVEEKKALESLIGTLRSHLTRLTSELSSHQDLLTQLRELRDEDAGVVKAKGVEIEKLKEQVERLGGEVEVLRGVVEEGLRERRGRERADGDETQNQEAQNQEEQDDVLANQTHHFDHTHGATLAASVNTPNHNAGLNRAAQEMSEGTRQKHRNDYGYAYDASTVVPVARFMDSAEFERISASRSLDGTRLDGLPDEDDEEEEELEPFRRRAAMVEDVDEEEEAAEEEESFHRPESPSPPSLASIQAQVDAGPSNQRQRQDTQQTRAHAHATRPITSSPNASRRHSGETPFPQIRGTHLEKLFFAAPDHDEKTCGVCQRRDKASGGGEKEQVEEWFRRREQRRQEEEEEEEDEGFAEGFAEDSDQFNEPQPTAGPSKSKGKEPEGANLNANRWKLKAQTEGLPPQTVVARVIRELEDDFTHYKGIYCELADQYKDMDPVSDVPKRNVLAKHLREVVDILEQKGDQIAALYDLLSFKDKPVSESVVPPAQPATQGTPLATKLRNLSTIAVASRSVPRRGGRNL